MRVSSSHPIANWRSQNQQLSRGNNGVARRVAVASVGPPCGVFAGVVLKLTGAGVGVTSTISEGRAEEGHYLDDSYSAVLVFFESKLRIVGGCLLFRKPIRGREICLAVGDGKGRWSLYLTDAEL
jgi:hypothetical protein